MTKRYLLNFFTTVALICLSANTLAAATHAAGKINVAVASNFTQTMQQLADDFQKRTGHQALVSSASTGKLYTQIHNGAPFDVFLSADEKHPDMLVTEGKASAEHARIYALGKLVMLSNLKPDGECQSVLGSPALKHLAIANPDTAPYGAAAKQVMEKLKLWETLQPKLVTGENIAQALQFVSTGSASVGFVAKSMLVNNDKIASASACAWEIPADMYSPIKQKMVMLSKAKNNPAAQDFWDYLQTDAATSIIKNSGYDVP